MQSYAAMVLVVVDRRYIRVSFCGKCLISLLGELLCHQAKLIECSSHSLVPSPCLPFPTSHTLFSLLLIDALECFCTENAAFDCDFEVLLFSPCCLLRTVLMVCFQEVLQYLGGYGKPVLQLIYPLLHYGTALYYRTFLIALYSTSTTGVRVLPSC
jgi:hypothetical protein